MFFIKSRRLAEKIEGSDSEVIVVIVRRSVFLEYIDEFAADFLNHAGSALVVVGVIGGVVRSLVITVLGRVVIFLNRFNRLVASEAEEAAATLLTLFCRTFSGLVVFIFRVVIEEVFIVFFDGTACGSSVCRFGFYCLHHRIVDGSWRFFNRFGIVFAYIENIRRCLNHTCVRLFDTIEVRQTCCGLEKRDNVDVVGIVAAGDAEEYASGHFGNAHRKFALLAEFGSKFRQF